MYLQIQPYSRVFQRIKCSANFKVNQMKIQYKKIVNFKLFFQLQNITLKLYSQFDKAVKGRLHSKQYIRKVGKMENQWDCVLKIKNDQQSYFNQNSNEESFNANSDKFKNINDSYSLSYKKKNSTKKNRTLTKHNQNQELQDLLDSQTVIYVQALDLNTQKKRLFNDFSLFSRDQTNDLTSQQGYVQIMNKIHFQRSRNRQLNQALVQLKESLNQQYLSDFVEQFKYLSEQNKRLRQLYKKQAGGYKSSQQQKNQSFKQQESQKSNTILTQENQTPRTNKGCKKSNIMGGNQILGSLNSKLNFNLKQKQCIGIGNNSFYEPKRMEALKQNKLLYCESSINMCAGQSLVPSPKRHKRRESQLTERKEYQNNQNDYLLIFDDNEAQLQSLETGRMSQPGKMPKRRSNMITEVNQLKENQSVHWAQAPNKGIGMQSNNNVTNNSETKYNQQQSALNSYQPATAKNIFIQFLSQLLLEQKVSYNQVSQEINDQVDEEEKQMNIPSHENIKFIEKLQQQIVSKNIKLRQLQDVIHIFKTEIEQIMGTDIKAINQLMIELLEVKGKYLEMQDRVNSLHILKKQLQTKEKVKESLLENIKAQIDKKHVNKQHKSQEQSQEKDQQFQVFPIPQSIMNLFQMLNIKMKKKVKPIDYLSEIRGLTKNKQLLQPIDSKKRGVAHLKIKQAIDSIREGRKKFNEVIKIYEGRIEKLQEKIHKYKNQSKTQKQHH